MSKRHAIYQQEKTSSLLMQQKLKAWKNSK